MLLGYLRVMEPMQIQSKYFSVLVKYVIIKHTTG